MPTLFWPWWLGALALAATTLVYWFWVGRPLGVSASWSRLLGAGAATAAADESFARALTDRPDAMAAALAAATLAEFPDAGAAAPPAETSARRAIDPIRLLPRAAHVVFLASLGLGGFIGALASPRGFAVHTTLGTSFERLFPSPWAGAVGLVVGGVMVGFGTRMAGGCTSGHGLSGVSRFQVGSLVATGVFFGTGILTAVVLHRVMS